MDKFLQEIDTTISRGPFAATWDSLRSYEVPKWYTNAKFGIFVHWGVYSVPGFGNEWYPREMYKADTPEYKHHIDTYGPQTEFGYKDFIPQFRGERFDPAQWAELFRKAGAGFVVPVAEHHDGFAMYDCAFSEWTAAKMGPKRDTIRELCDAVRNAGMTFGLSSHRAEHFWFFDGGMQFDSDVKDPANAGLYGPAQPGPADTEDRTDSPPTAEFLDDWLLRTCELVDKYRPQLVWFDWWIQNLAFAPYLRKFAAYYYNRASQWEQGVAINYKYGAFEEGTAVFDIERGQLSDVRNDFWQTDTALSKNSWGYINGHDYKSVESIIHDLVDIVSKNGALLLNVGPAPDGTIPGPEEKMLREIGEWLDLNGAAIYGTRPWRCFGEGPTKVSDGTFTDTERSSFTAADIRFTSAGNTLYAIMLAWPGEQLTIKSLANENPAEVTLLGHAGSLKWAADPSGLHVQLPPEKPCKHAYVLKIKNQGR